MVIVCGVDDSARTLQAAQAAAALARRADEALVLLHAQEAFLLNMDVEPDGTVAETLAAFAAKEQADLLVPEAAEGG